MTSPSSLRPMRTVAEYIRGLWPLAFILGVVATGLFMGRIVAGYVLAVAAIALAVLNIALVYKRQKYGHGASIVPVVASILGLAAAGCVSELTFFLKWWTAIWFALLIMDFGSWIVAGLVFRLLGTGKRPPPPN